MVNKELWDSAYQKMIQLHPNDIYNFRECIREMTEALGEDEGEALEFMRGLEGEEKEWLHSLVEEITDKFKSEEMERCIQDEIIAPAVIRQATQ